MERTVSRRSNGRQVSIGGLGSGVLVSADGKIVTAAHVVQTADTVVVEFADQDPVGEVIASNPRPTSRCCRCSASRTA